MEIAYHRAMAPSSAVCPERQRLFAAFKSTNQLLNEIHESEIQALLIDDIAMFEGLGTQLQEARETRDIVAEALLRHMREHGC